jgi:hypothetical protein
MQNSKDVFFYSNYCDFSKDVTNIITKYNLRDMFMYVCVDNKKYNIPTFIDRVPSILKKTGEVYTDEELYKYLEKRNKLTNIQDEISPMISVYGNSFYSTNFSSIDGNDTSIDNPNYLSLGREQHMIHVTDDDSSKKISDSSSAFEKLMESRKLDDKFLKETVARPNS